jgi:putative oxidoreductase
MIRVPLSGPLATTAGPAVICIRLAVGLVFLPEGIQKLLFPEILGSGRFADIGIPLPELMGPLVGWVELICGFMILLGFFTRMAAMPLIVIMVVAIVSTKVPIGLGHDWLIFSVRPLAHYGFWSFLHETRTDWAMLMGSLYLLAAGSGPWSVDGLTVKRALAA